MKIGCFLLYFKALKKSYLGVENEKVFEKNKRVTYFFTVGNCILDYYFLVWNK